MFSTTVIPTINRHTLTRAVQSVLNQQFDKDEFEVIVVNDSGSPLPYMNWMDSRRVQVINTNRHERSVARNTGAAIARGKYLHFLDDDDLLLPGALQTFWELDRTKGDAIWLSGSYQSVDNQGNVIEDIHPENQGNNFALLVSGEGIPLQASLLETVHFFKVGCYDPKLTACEDRDLGRRFAMNGTVCYTNRLVSQIRIGMEGSSTNWLLLAESDRFSREKAFNLPHSFARLWSSAKSCLWHGRLERSYWHGRVSRSYFASGVWNFRNGNFLIALSRVVSGFVFMNLLIFSVNFWQGFRQVDLFTGLPTTRLLPAEPVDANK